jgi:hypothetical protein
VNGGVSLRRRSVNGSGLGESPCCALAAFFLAWPLPLAAPRSCAARSAPGTALPSNRRTPRRILYWRF